MDLINNKTSKKKTVSKHKKTEVKQIEVSPVIKKKTIKELDNIEYFDFDMFCTLIKKQNNKALYMRQDGQYIIISIGIEDSNEFVLQMWSTSSRNRADEKFYSI
jgi:hypothetical protein